MIEVTNVTLPSEKKALTSPLVPTVRIASTEEGESLRVKIVYVGSPSSDEYDQVICDETVEDIPKGIVEFELECTVPEIEKIPLEYLIGVTSIIVVFYNKEGLEFARIGYFLKVEYPGLEVAKEQEEAFSDETSEDVDEDASGGVNEDVNEGEENELLQEESNELGQEENGDHGELTQDEDAEAARAAAGDGVLRVSKEDLEHISIDISKLEVEVLEPPLVTIFTEAWSSRNSSVNNLESFGEEKVDL